ncbi:MAG: Nramp family divalent metal transporter, partial [Planctomycetota bacterium]|nr:Nramp family divalent metal transporter [Planctomycetota bacterium]
MRGTNTRKTQASDPGPSSGILPPPPTFWRRLRYLGPGLIITASIVGSGELIMTTKLGAEAGFTLLWLVILGCVVKVFVQVELGRYVMSSGETALEAMNRVPGPRVVVSWLLWIWLAMFFSLFFQVSGIAGTLAAIFTSHLDEDASRGWSVFWIIAITLTVIGLLVWGRYRLVERFSTAMVFFFTFTTILAVCLLQWTDYALRAEEIWHGLSFRITRPDGELVNFTTAFAAFGITGVGASELIYYPYWCLEKGYARVVGPREESVEWEERAKGWIRVLRTDAFLSLIVYTVATVAFYLLGAAVLPTALAGHSLSDVSGTELVRTLATMYENTFGDWGFFLFLVGAFFVLYSTYFVATASNARVLTDALGLFRVLRYDHPGS